MNIGSLILAPNGYSALLRDIEYHLIANPSSASLVTLAWFARDANIAKVSDCWYAGLQRIDRADFEAGIRDGALRAKANDRGYPPWLTELEGLDPDAVEELRHSRKHSYRDYATSRFNHIAGLVEQGDHLFTSNHLDHELAEHAAACTPRQRTARVRLWLSAYLSFGHNLFALSPAYGQNGRWDRTQMKDPTKKLGRPNRRNGTESGYSAIPLVPQILAAYQKHAKLGKPLREIYIDALVYSFGCKAEPGGATFYQPDGKPFPSLDQFEYHATKALGREVIQRQKYGDPRYRNKLARSRGKFSQATSNVLETLEADVNYLRERPTRLLSKEPGDPLATCRMVCLTTGYTSGVGFSYGAERSEAYTSAWFFSAAPKSLLGRMFGIDITDDDFPCTGAPLKYTYDRGAGCGTTHAMGADDAPPILNMAPSWMGQSKASVESTHPRHAKVDGQPTYTQSDLSVFQLAKREILRAAADNRSKDCSARLTPEMIAAHVPANPNGMVRYLAARGRVDTVSVPLDRLIRGCLRPIHFTLDSQGLWFFHVRYTSKEFDVCASIPRPHGSQRVLLDGYVAPLSVRLAWVEWRGRLIEVTAMLAIRDDEDQLFISLSDLMALDLARSELAAAQHKEKVVAKVVARDRFTDATGRQWDRGVVKSGKAPSRGAHRSASDPVPTQSAQRSA